MIYALALLLVAAGVARYGEGFAVGVAGGMLVGAAFWMRLGQHRRGYAHGRRLW
jgi:hypothetical protein